MNPPGSNGGDIAFIRVDGAAPQLQGLYLIGGFSLVTCAVCAILLLAKLLNKHQMTRREMTGAIGCGLVALVVSLFSFGIASSLMRDIRSLQSLTSNDIAQIDVYRVPQWRGGDLAEYGAPIAVIKERDRVESLASALKVGELLNTDHESFDDGFLLRVHLSAPTVQYIYFGMWTESSRRTGPVFVVVPMRTPTDSSLGTYSNQKPFELLRLWKLPATNNGHQNPSTAGEPSTQEHANSR